MTTRTSTILKTERAEACLREILRVASCGQVNIDAAGVLINGVRDRAGMLTDLRTIKGKAIEAEVLLRSIGERDQLAGVAQVERRQASLPGDEVSTPHPAPPKPAR